jgi:hypothetical protein
MPSPQPDFDPKKILSKNIFMIDAPTLRLLEISRFGPTESMISERELSQCCCD